MTRPGPVPAVILLSEEQVGSYGVIGEMFAGTLSSAGVRVRHLPFGALRGSARRWAGRVVIQNTIGPRFAPIPGCRNIALVHHEWDRYPAAWVRSLNLFAEVWVTTHFVRQTLVRSGVAVPVRLRRPALDLDEAPQKRDYSIRGPVLMFACGAAHFRKGFHLLIEGFLRAFPDEGAAHLVIHTDESGRWNPPRSDIEFDYSRPGREAMLRRYAEFDFYVSASLGEGLGLPVAEAILAGVPVVTHAWGGHRDVLENGCFFSLPHRVVLQPFCSRPDYYAAGQRCAVVPVEAMARTLRAAAESPAEVRRRMAAGARRALLRRFGRRAVVGRFLADAAPGGALAGG